MMPPAACPVLDETYQMHCVCLVFETDMVKGGREHTVSATEMVSPRDLRRSTTSLIRGRREAGGNSCVILLKENGIVDEAGLKTEALLMVICSTEGLAMMRLMSDDDEVHWSWRHWMASSPGYIYSAWQSYSNLYQYHSIISL